MKKTMAMVGTGALMMALTLGSGFAQQTSPTPAVPGGAVVQPKVGAPEDLVKDKVPVPKPAETTAAEAAKTKASEAVKPVQKDVATKAVEPVKPADKAVTEAKPMEKSVVPKPEAAPPADKASTAAPATVKDAGQAAQGKPVPLKTEDATAAGKQAVEKKAVEKASDLKDAAKPAAKE
ncbi:MAG: hypothetical protein MUF52_10775 [Syntrophobacteraceae bacterium]|nr:hypothetical protein [Syntrophobacteraceae bacterium]